MIYGELKKKIALVGTMVLVGASVALAGCGKAEGTNITTEIATEGTTHTDNISTKAETGTEEKTSETETSSADNLDMNLYEDLKSMYAEMNIDYSIDDFEKDAKNGTVPTSDEMESIKESLAVEESKLAEEKNTEYRGEEIESSIAESINAENESLYEEYSSHWAENPNWMPETEPTTEVAAPTKPSLSSNENDFSKTDEENNKILDDIATESSININDLKANIVSCLEGYEYWITSGCGRAGKTVGGITYKTTDPACQSIAEYTRELFSYLQYGYCAQSELYQIDNNTYIDAGAPEWYTFDNELASSIYGMFYGGAYGENCDIDPWNRDQEYFSVLYDWCRAGRPTLSNINAIALSTATSGGNFDGKVFDEGMTSDLNALVYSDGRQYRVYLMTQNTDGHQWFKVLDVKEIQ